MARFAKIGIGPGLPFDADALDDEVREAIRAGIAAARQAVPAALSTKLQKFNGWTFSDVFGTREWYGGNFLLRAVAAMAGWGGNDVIEARRSKLRIESLVQADIPISKDHKDANAGCERIQPTTERRQNYE